MVAWLGDLRAEQLEFVFYPKGIPREEGPCLVLAAFVFIFIVMGLFSLLGVAAVGFEATALKRGAHGRSVARWW